MRELSKFEQAKMIANIQALLDSGQEDQAKTMLEYFKRDSMLDNSLVIENGKIQPPKSPGERWLDQFITIDPDTIAMKEDARKIARSPYEVLITGETGTGKELIAKSMIDAREGPIKAINCAGIPRELLESELFGHVKGSFTGASSDKEGLFAAAKGGIIMLDEISKLDLLMQPKLLRVIQEKSIRRVGGLKEEPIDCKIVCVTNQNLKARVEHDLFQRDLYARISTFELHIKPLRERSCDILPILESLPDGKEFLAVPGDHYLDLDLSINVRALQRAVVRWKVLGRIN